jgi:hypothetical protein
VPGHLGLDPPRPLNGGVAPAAIEHDRGAALPDAVQVQTVLTHIHHLSGSGEGLPLVDLGGYGLVDRPNNEGHQESG